jgi:deoxyribodipyrimidine photo-lyase
MAETGQLPVVMWFREDLRLSDNPALHAAAATGQPLLCVYIDDRVSADIRPLGGASRWWLHHSLTALDNSVQQRGARLHVLHGPADDCLNRLVQASSATGVVWNRRYGSGERRLDERIKIALKGRGVDARSFKGALLNEPWDVTSRSTGDPMKVFTPYWRRAREVFKPSPLLPAPERISTSPWPAGLDDITRTVADLHLLPTKPDWAGGLRETWVPGETTARSRLAAFLDTAIRGYGDHRNRPDKPSTSRLSPHLRFGEISPGQIWEAATFVRDQAGAGGASEDTDKFLTEIGWREFSYHLLYHAADLPTRNFQSKFDRFPWRTDDDALTAWQRGRTGYPIVDAGMRQLWQTGWMHNRVRMITGSFLVKHLLIDWREGERWFWDTLVDADPANNAASWQWVAGTGADAAPYFRIFNPMLQGEKFDPKADYVRQYVPELAGLPNDVIHKPWTATPAALARAGVRLGQTYPQPIIAHDAARARALQALASISPAA